MKSTLIQELNVAEIKLTQKIYADTPPDDKHRRRATECMWFWAQFGWLNRSSSCDRLLAPPAAEPQAFSARRRSTVRPADGAFLFTDLTGPIESWSFLLLTPFLFMWFRAGELANEYMEWNCVKTNKYGRRQNRVIGVDGTHIFNKRPAGNRANVRFPAQIKSNCMCVSLRCVCSNV